MRRAPALCLAVLVAAPCSPAQTLDLSATPVAPGPDQGRRALAIADLLASEAAAMEHDARAADGHRLRALRVRIDARRLAESLLRRGESLGEQGSIHVLTGLRAADAVKDFDAAAERIGTGLDQWAGLSLASDRFHAEMLTLGELPAGPGELDKRLRDLLAILVDAGGLCAELAPPGQFGWVPEPVAPEPDLASSIDPWLASGAISDQTAASLRAFEATLAEASTWCAFRATARGHRAALVNAGAIAGTLPEWVSQAAGRRLHSSFDAAAAAYIDPAQRPGAIERLAGLAAVARVIKDIETADPLGRFARPAHDALSAAILAAETDAAGASSAMRALERAAGLLAGRRALPEEREIVRPARVAWRAAQDRADATERALVAVLPRLADRPDAMSEPGFVGAIAAHRRAVEDLRAIASISRHLSPGDEEAAPTAIRVLAPSPELRARERLALSRVLSLGQEAAADPMRSTALAQLRDFGRDLDDLMELPGERGIRDKPSAAWDRLTAKRTPDLLGRVEAERIAWLAAWSEAQRSPTRATEAAAAAARLRSLRRLAVLIDGAASIDDALSARKLGQPVPLDSWPGWRLSDDAMAGLLARAESSLPTVVAAVLDQPRPSAPTSPPSAPAVLEDVERDLRPLVLAAEMVRRAAGAGVPPAAPLAIIAGAGAPDAWMWGRRERLAAVCRYVEEAAAGEAPGGPGAWRHAATIADDLLASLAQR